MPGTHSPYCAERDAVHLLYRAMQRWVWLSMLACVLVWLGGLRHVAAGPVSLWLLGALFALGVRRYLMQRRTAAQHFAESPAREFRIAALGAAVSGFTLGSFSVLFAPELPATDRFLAAIFFMGMAAGATSVLTASRLVFVSFASPILVAQAVGLLRAVDPGDTSDTVHIVAAIAIYALAVFMAQSWSHRTLMSTIVMRRENEKAVRKKEALLIKLELDNAELLADRDAFLLASLTDPLTELANRRHFDKTLARDWERARRESMWLSCIMLDVDHFKPFNDRHGHAVGDATLKRVAEVITRSLNRGADFAARYGGEEFVILLPGTRLKGAELLAERIRASIESMEFHGSERLTMSCGVAAMRPVAECDADASQLLSRADVALYEAKASGRNRVVAAPAHSLGPDALGDTA